MAQGAGNSEQQIIGLLSLVAKCNRALGRYDDEIDNLREIYDKTRAAYGRDEKTYNAALRYSRALVKQLYLRDALVLLHQVGLHAEEDLGEGHALVIELASASCLSVWLYHFYGHESYRGQLLTAVKNVLNLLPYAQDADQTRQIEKSLCMVLTHQLDWSLDDLELDSTERQIVDRVLADWPALDFELEFN